MKKVFCFLTACFYSISAFAYPMGSGSGFKSKGEAKDTTVSTVHFSKNLSSSDTDVQHALETLDQLSAGGASIGGAVTGGTDTAIPYVHPGATLAQDVTHLSYDPSTYTLTAENATLGGGAHTFTDDGSCSLGAGLVQIQSGGLISINTGGYIYFNGTGGQIQGMTYIVTDANNILNFQGPLGAVFMILDGSNVAHYAVQFRATVSSQLIAAFVDSSLNTQVSFNGSGVMFYNQSTASRALATDASKNLVSATTTLTQLQYLDSATGRTGTGNIVLATSPTLTTASLGSSTATTQTAGDNSTKLATTAYVATAVTNIKSTANTYTAVQTFAGVRYDYKAKTANYTITTADYLIDCTSNSFTITLPTAASVSGETHIIKNSGTGLITFATTSSQTMDGIASAAAFLRNQWQYVQLTSDGSNWKVTGGDISV